MKLVGAQRHAEEPPRNGCCAGTASIAVGTFCYTVDIRTEHGVVFFLITPGSAVVELDAHGLPRCCRNFLFPVVEHEGLFGNPN